MTECRRNFTREQIVAGLKAGRSLMVDRRDAPEFADLLELEAQGLVKWRLVEFDEQSSALRFTWAAGAVGEQSSSGGTRDEQQGTEPSAPVADTEVERLRMDCAELYQVIGTMAEHCPDPEDPSIIKALDNASDAAAGDPRRHNDLLPFILPGPGAKGT